jgi:hypothetical protein
MWRAPWTVIAFVLLQLQIPINALTDEKVSADTAVSLLIFTILMGFLWRGSRVAWTILFVLEAFAVLVQPFDPAPWWAWALNLIGLALLIAPPTRGHVWGSRAREAARAGARTRRRGSDRS